ncbi:MAG: hypothetical protein NTX29_10150 [Actinobacteria bacterium]|nr:hypothetical protein [Actinomycetota bacterium]
MPDLHLCARRAATAVCVASAFLALAIAPSNAAPSGAGGTTTVTTKSGLSLTVTPVRRLPSSATVHVTGKGYDRTVGIYVALCVTPVKGVAPSPCGGGVNMSGASAASAWISSNPPPYGVALAVPYRRGGRFDVTMSVSPMIGTVDCRQASCAIVTRADHTRPGERRFDVVVPVTFAP